MVDGYEHLIPTMTNHEKDRHVLAAAVSGGADTIVTNNVKDFPLAACEQYAIDVDTPDEFLMDLWVTDPGRMARMLIEWAPKLSRPPYAVQELLERQLSKQAPTFSTTVLASDDLKSAIEAHKNGVPVPTYRLI